MLVRSLPSTTFKPVRRRGLLDTSTRRNRRRGVEMLEFAILLPIFIFILMFTIDMGNVIFLSGTLHDAVFVAARSGAQVGAGCYNDPVGGDCAGPSRNAFNQALAGIPGVRQSYVNSFAVTEGATCTNVPGGNYVVVRASYRVHFITPGLFSLINVATAGHGWSLSATGVARCEVVRG